MYRLATISSCLFLVLLTILLYCFHFEYHHTDQSLYQTLMEQNTRRSRKKKGMSPAHQRRHEVQKDLWRGGLERTHFRLTSQGSTLTLKQGEKKFEAVEQFEDFACWLQESVDEAAQREQVHLLTGKSGLYSFPAHQFLALNPTLYLYDLPGTSLPDTFPETLPWITAFAETASLTATEPITAYRLHGNTDQGVCFQAEQMIWGRQEKEAYFRGNVEIDAPEKAHARGDEGVLVYREDHTLAALSLHGHVQLESHRAPGKTCRAVADHLQYRPETGIAILTADTPHQVLVWQEDLRLSAPEVHVHYDPKTKQETVEGIGDVHFLVDWENPP